MFILSGEEFWDSLIDACDTIIGISGSSRALCLHLSLPSAQCFLLRILKEFGNNDGDNKEGWLSCLGSDGLG